MRYISRVSLATLTAWLGLAIGICFFASCKSDPKLTLEKLYGRWELTKALRNERETEMLTGTWFRFDPNGQMETNLPLPEGSSMPVAYDLQAKEIIQKTPEEVRYKVTSFLDTVLCLQFEMQGQTFALELLRAAADAPLETLPETPDTAPLQDTMPGK